MFSTEICKLVAESIWGDISRALQSIQKLKLDEANKELEFINEVVTKKADSFPNDYPDDVFNEGFILTELVDLIKDYVSYLKLLVSDQFSESWSALQDVQDRLRIIYRFTNEPRPLILSHIERQCGELEKLYPYQVFFSVGIVKETAECSICGKSIDSFECEHIAGELYRGHLAYGIVKHIKKIDHISMVANPADKRCTVQIPDTSEKFNGIAYLAKGIREHVLEPLSFSHLEFKTVRKPNYGTTLAGRNDPCPCGSGKKFKKCCINKSYVETTHVDIASKRVILDNLLRLYN